MCIRNMCWKSRVNVSFILVLLTNFLYIMSVESVPYDHTFEATSFNFNVWRESIHGFECPGTQKYKLLCEKRWGTIIAGLEECIDLGLQSAGSSADSTVFVCLLAIEAAIIGGLVVYSCRMRKKVKYYQELNICNATNNIFHNLEDVMVKQ